MKDESSNSDYMSSLMDVMPAEDLRKHKMIEGTFRPSAYSFG